MVLDKGKIAFVSTWKVPCGIYRFTSQLSDSVERLGYATRIFSFKNGHNGSMGDDRATYVAYRDDPDYPAKFAQAIMAWGADGVSLQHEYGIFPDSDLFIGMVQEIERDGTKTATTFHSMFERLTKHQARTVYNTLKSGSAAVFPMEYQLRRLPGNLRRYGFGNGDVEGLTRKVSIIPHGVPVMKNGHRTKDDYKAMFGLRGKKVLLMTRGWSLNKGHDRVARMWPYIVSEVGPEWMLVWAGDVKSKGKGQDVYPPQVRAQDMFIEKMYMRVYEECPAKDSILLRRDIRPETEPLYSCLNASGDVAALPYVKGRIPTINAKGGHKFEIVKGESQSGTVCDVLGANAYMQDGDGVMLVGSDIEGLGIQIKDSGGFAVEPGNDEALKSSLIEAMRNEDLRRERYIQAKRYSHEFSWDNVGKKQVAIF